MVGCCVGRRAGYPVPLAASEYPRLGSRPLACFCHLTYMHSLEQDNPSPALLLWFAARDGVEALRGGVGGMLGSLQA
jgi:hypothetical protein